MMQPHRIFLTKEDLRFFGSLNTSAQSRLYDSLRQKGVNCAYGFIFPESADGESNEVSVHFSAALAHERIFQEIDHLWSGLSKQDQARILLVMVDVIPCWLPTYPVPTHALERMLEVINSIQSSHLDQQEESKLQPKDKMLCDITLNLFGLATKVGEVVLIQVLCGIAGSKNPTTGPGFFRWLHCENPSEDQLALLHKIGNCDQKSVHFVLIEAWSRPKMSDFEKGMIAGMCGFKDHLWTLQGISYALTTMDADSKLRVLTILMGLLESK